MSNSHSLVVLETAGLPFSMATILGVSVSASRKGSLKAIMAAARPLGGDEEFHPTFDVEWEFLVPGYVTPRLHHPRQYLIILDHRKRLSWECRILKCRPEVQNDRNEIRHVADIVQ